MVSAFTELKNVNQRKQSIGYITDVETTCVRALWIKKAAEYYSVNRRALARYDNWWRGLILTLEFHTSNKSNSSSWKVKVLCESVPLLEEFAFPLLEMNQTNRHGQFVRNHSIARKEAAQ